MDHQANLSQINTTNNDECEHASEKGCRLSIIRLWKFFFTANNRTTHFTSMLSLDENNGNERPSSPLHTSFTQYHCRQINHFWPIGVAIICMGALSFLLQILSIITKATAYRLGAGVWCGSFFIITGFLTALTGSRSTPNKTLPHLLFWVFFSASICCPTMLMIAMYGIAADLVKSRSIFFATTNAKSTIIKNNNVCKDYIKNQIIDSATILCNRISDNVEIAHEPITDQSTSVHQSTMIWPAIFVNFMLLVVDFVVFILQVWVAIGACKLLATPATDPQQYEQLRRRQTSSLIISNCQRISSCDYPPPPYSDIYSTNSTPRNSQSTTITNAQHMRHGNELQKQ